MARLSWPGSGRSSMAIDCVRRGGDIVDCSPEEEPGAYPVLDMAGSVDEIPTAILAAHRARSHAAKAEVCFSDNTNGLYGNGYDVRAVCGRCTASYSNPRGQEHGTQDARSRGVGVALRVCRSFGRVVDTVATSSGNSPGGDGSECRARVGNPSAIGTRCQHAPSAVAAIAEFDGAGDVRSYSPGAVVATRNLSAAFGWAS